MGRHSGCVHGNTEAVPDTSTYIHTGSRSGTRARAETWVEVHRSLDRRTCELQRSTLGGKYSLQHSCLIHTGKHVRKYALGVATPPRHPCRPHLAFLHVPEGSSTQGLHVALCCWGHCQLLCYDFTQL